MVNKSSGRGRLIVELCYVTALSLFFVQLFGGLGLVHQGKVMAQWNMPNASEHETQAPENGVDEDVDDAYWDNIMGQVDCNRVEDNVAAINEQGDGGAFDWMIAQDPNDFDNFLADLERENEEARQHNNNNNNQPHSPQLPNGYLTPPDSDTEDDNAAQQQMPPAENQAFRPWRPWECNDNNRQQGPEGRSDLPAKSNSKSSQAQSQCFDQSSTSVMDRVTNHLKSAKNSYMTAGIVVGVAALLAAGAFALYEWHKSGIDRDEKEQLNEGKEIVEQLQLHSQTSKDLKEKVVSMLAHDSVDAKLFAGGAGKQLEQLKPAAWQVWPSKALAHDVYQHRRNAFSKNRIDKLKDSYSEEARNVDERSMFTSNGDNFFIVAHE